jgi:predicted O-methyltransferase YrrM
VQIAAQPRKGLTLAAPYVLRWTWHTLRRLPMVLAAAVWRVGGDLPALAPAALYDPAITPGMPILDDINLPPYHWIAEHDDYAPLMRLALARQPRVVLELGTANGNLTANLCQHLPAARIYTVNALAADQTGDDQRYRYERDQIGRVYRQHGFSDRVVQIYANTLHMDLSQYFDGPVVDLAIIDACHDVSYVVNDFNKVLPFLSDRAVVLLHDTDPHLAEQIKASPLKGHLVNSYFACLLLRRRGYDIRHLTGTWWAVWSRAPQTKPG